MSANPERIRTSLEDFKPWARYSAIEAFYRLLERLNHRTSPLESNDCAFEGPRRNENRIVAKALECSGRVMVLFRALARNGKEGEVQWLKNALHHALSPLDPNFQSGMVGTTIIPVSYLALPEPSGEQLMISFWAWGNSELENMQNLERLLKNLTLALRKVASLCAQ